MHVDVHADVHVDVHLDVHADVHADVHLRPPTYLQCLHLTPNIMLRQHTSHVWDSHDLVENLAGGGEGGGTSRQFGASCFSQLQGPDSDVLDGL